MDSATQSVLADWILGNVIGIIIVAAALKFIKPRKIKKQ